MLILWNFIDSCVIESLFFKINDIYPTKPKELTYENNILPLSLEQDMMDQVKPLKPPGLEKMKTNDVKDVWLKGNSRHIIEIFDSYKDGEELLL